MTGPSSTIGKKAVPSSTINKHTIGDDDQTIAVQEIEQLLRNIGAFGGSNTNCGITHDDVEIIVSEHSSATTISNSTMNNSNQSPHNPAGEPIRADQILMQLL